MVPEILKRYKKIHPIRIDLPGTGFGAVILTTMNLIRYCERNNYYPVASYDADCNTPFFDPDYSNEVWTQYFEPIMPLSYDDLQLCLKANLKDKNIQEWLHHLTSDQAVKISEEHPDSVYSFPFGKWRSEDLGSLDDWYAQQRAKGRETIGKYVKPKAHIMEKVESFSRKHFSDAFVLGVHIRGTDLHYAPVVSPAEYFPHIDACRENHPDMKIFLATDQAQYIDVFKNRYKDDLIYSDCFRSDNEVAPFLRKEISPYSKGEDVLLDILLLSRADFLIKGSSNVGEMALYFNKDLDCIDLGYKKNKAFGQSYDRTWDNKTNPPAWKLVSQHNLEEIAPDAASQSWLQLAQYEMRRWSMQTRIFLGKVKRKILS